MLSKLLQPQVIKFIQQQEKRNLKPADFDRLLFNKLKHPDIPMELAVNQLRARKKAKNKLPQWYKTEGIVFPPLLSMEQCSSELAAKYKSKLMQGDLAVDLTGGAGVDAYYLSKTFKRVIYVDLNKDLAEIATHNFKTLGVENIEVVNGKSEEYISQFSDKVDLIYIDPARRNQHKKLFLLEDCSPNILLLQSTLLLKSDVLMVKTSPMLDITKGVAQLQNVSEIEVVGIKNEVKEVLFIQNRKPQNNVIIKAIDLAAEISFCTEWSSKEKASISGVSTYLYEPNATIFKTGKLDNLANQFNVFKLNKNTNLFTSAHLEKDFPGRVFHVKHVLKYEKKEIKEVLASKEANIAVRNFPDTVDIMRKKLGLKSGGSTYLFGVRNAQNRAKIIVCSKI